MLTPPALQIALELRAAGADLVGALQAPPSAGSASARELHTAGLVGVLVAGGMGGESTSRTRGRQAESGEFS